MGLNPTDSVVMARIVEEWGEPEFESVGDLEPYENWDNIPPSLDEIDDVLEECYTVITPFSLSERSGREIATSCILPTPTWQSETMRC
jgi:hypothetical protein